MTPSPKERFRQLLLEECKIGKLDWYYISYAGHNGFIAGHYVQAFGPSDAWNKFHALGWYGETGTTQTTGPLPLDKVALIKDQYKWRPLNQEEMAKQYQEMSGK